MKTLPIIILKILFASIFLLNFKQVYSQNNSSILYGKVVDFENKLPLEYATILLKKDGIVQSSTSSDTAGNFLFEVSPGEYEISCKYIGYNEYITTNLVVIANSSKNWNFSMKIHENFTGCCNMGCSFYSGIDFFLTENKTTFKSKDILKWGR